LRTAVKQGLFRPSTASSRGIECGFVPHR